MRYKLFLLIILLQMFLYSKSLHIIVNNSNSKSFQREDYYFSKFLLSNNLLSDLDISKIYFINKMSTFDREILPTLRQIKRYRTNINVVKLINRLINYRRIKSGDVVVIISSLDYINNQVNINSKNKTFNDGWITSGNSPFKKLLEKYPNKPLSGLNIFVLDPNRNLKYINNRRRFYSFLFSKFGANLLYYGSLDLDYKRIYDYIISEKNFDNIFQNPQLKQENILKLDNSVIQYNLE